MREEAQAWLEQAKADFSTAQNMITSRAYYMAAFLAHQTTEKMLKGTIIEIKRQMPPRTHNLIDLGQALNAPEGIMSALRMLNPEYVTSRYPDAANGTPAENYDLPKAKMLLEAAEKVRKWVNSVLTR
jgi:HEPN domain-containing protein